MTLWVQNLLDGVTRANPDSSLESSGATASDAIIDLTNSAFPLRWRSPIEWAHNAIKDLPAFMIDHAACERKVSATCMTFVVKYPDRPEFVEAMIQVAIEEMEHFQQVFRILRSRNLTLGPDTKTEYVNRFLQLNRTSPEDRFLDRMLCFGIIEARGCERFALIGEALARENREPELSAFYKDLAREEAKHFGIFLRYAKTYFPSPVVEARLQELLDQESLIIKELPWRHALH